MASDLHSRLLSARQQLLSALNDVGLPDSGSSALDEFIMSWGTLCDDIHRALRAESSALDGDTIALAHKIAIEFQVIAQNFSSWKQAAAGIEMVLCEQIDDILLVDPTLPNIAGVEPHLSDAEHLNSTEEEPSALSYLEPCYQWLLAHLHEPYPSASDKQALASLASTSVDTISQWFANARRRIRWNKVCEDYFNNSRTDMVLFLRRYFNVDGAADIPSSDRSDMNPGCVDAIMEMENKAEALYSGRFRQSDMVTRLDSAIIPHDELDVDALCRRYDEERRKGKKKTRRIRVRVRSSSSSESALDSAVSDTETVSSAMADAIASYPSPRSALSPSPESSDEAIVGDAPRVAGHKRSFNASMQTDVEQMEPQEKRQRQNDIDSALSPSQAYPSPAASPLASTDVVDPWALALFGGPPTFPSSEVTSLEASSSDSTPPTYPNSNSTSRKRRLSTSEVEGAPKRPRGLSQLPRGYTVSDIFPTPSAAMVPEVSAPWDPSLTFGAPLFAPPPPLDNITPAEIALAACGPEQLSIGNFMAPAPAATAVLPTGHFDMPAQQLREATPAAFDFSHFVPSDPLGDNLDALFSTIYGSSSFESLSSSSQASSFTSSQTDATGLSLEPFAGSVDMTLPTPALTAKDGMAALATPFVAGVDDLAMAGHIPNGNEMQIWDAELMPALSPLNFATV